MNPLADETQMLHSVVHLLRSQRWAAMASLDHNQLPFASMVAYAQSNDMCCLYLHLSRLASHVQNITRNPRVSLVVSEPDDGVGNPQELARLSLSGDVQIIERDSPEYEEARTCYLRRLPDSEHLFEFADFNLFRLDLLKGRYVGGFGNAFSLSMEELRCLGSMQ